MDIFHWIYYRYVFFHSVIYSFIAYHHDLHLCTMLHYKNSFVIKIVYGLIQNNAGLLLSIN